MNHHNVNQFQQILQLQQLRQQQQAQALQQQNNRQQIQIFASPPNTNHVAQLPNNSVSNASTNPTTLFQIQQTANNRNTLSNTNGTDSNNVHNVSNGIQIQPLQILQMTQNNAANASNARTTANNAGSHNQNNHRQNSVQTVNARPISVTATATPLSSINLSSIPQISQIALIQRLQQRNRQHAAHQAQALQQQQHQQHNNVANNGHAGNAQFRQSIQQQMVAFIQQLQQFPPLFQHLQSNPQVLAQLLQQFKCKQEQNARDMQQRQQLPQQANIGNIQTFGNINIPMANTQHIGALLRNIHSAQQRQQAVAVQQAAAAAASANSTITIQQPPNTNNNNNNQGMLPALENENSSGSHINNANNARNRNGNGINANNQNSDDLIILNDNDGDIQSLSAANNTANNNSTNSTSNNMNMNANANNSKHGNVTNVGAISMPDINANGSVAVPPAVTGVADNGPPKLDFSQLKKMTIPIVEGGNKASSKEADVASQNAPAQNQSTSPLKRPFSTMAMNNVSMEKNQKEDVNESLPPSKRRRLNINNDSYPNKATITLSSDENDTNNMMMNSDNYNNYSNNNKRSRSPRSKKKKRRKKKKESSVPNATSNSKQDEVVSLISDPEAAAAPSFKDIVDRAKHDGDQDVIGDEDAHFVNDPLISQIATKMFEIRQINNNRRVATPEATGKISKGLDVLLQAIDEMSDDKHPQTKMQDGDIKKHRLSKRKNGELFVIDHSNKKENVTGGYSVHKIKSILETNYDYDNFFKLNENATFLANANDIELERGLRELAQQFTHHYNNGLLNVFKTCTHPIYKDKFSQCVDTKYSSIHKYYSIWNEIFNQHILCQMDAWLKNHSIKNAVGAIFALVDHLFSYPMYRHLCGNSYHCIPMKQSSAKGQKFESEKYVQLSGNLLFTQFEKDKERIQSIADVHIFWLFEYWKKVLLQSQEPVKCLCRSYLTNSAPNPYKNRLYVMVAQTSHAPHTAVVQSKPRTLKIKSKSASPSITSAHAQNLKENKYSRNKAKTPPNTKGHFIRRNTGTMSINGIIKSSLEKNSKNIPSSSVCGKTFMNATQCAQHTKDCKECNHRIVTIQSNV